MLPVNPVSRINQLASYSNGPCPIGEILPAVLAQYGLAFEGNDVRCCESTLKPAGVENSDCRYELV